MPRTRHCALLPAVLAVAVLAAGGVGTLAQKPGASVAFDRYHTSQEVNAALAAMQKANPAVTALHAIATSPGGAQLTALEIGPEAGQKARKTPAVLVVGNLEGVLPLSVEAALHLADHLLQSPAATKSLTWYILPNANPDAGARFGGKPLVADERNATRHNDDMDDQVDEDGPDDLDGNGVITEMRVKDPAGEWIPVEGEPRLMRRADPAKGEKGVYKIYQEGVDNDGDGEINEDPAGGVNIGLTFPHLFKQWTRTGGRWPGSEPETFGLIKFAIDHPEIAMTVSLGATNMCLQPPAGGRQGSFDANAVKIPEKYAVQFGADTSRTYSLKEIMEMVQPLVPPGMQLTESMIASFLGLGAVVNPLEEDLKYYKEFSEKYKEHLKAAKLDVKRLDPPQPKDGSFELWSYYHLGVPSFSIDFWTLPEAKAEEKEKSGITAESLEAMTPEAFVALGEAKLATFLKEVGAPDNIKPAMLLEGVKAGKMTPRQMAGMLKQMPKPKEATGADPKQKAWLAFSDKDLGGKGFTPWTAVKHPTLGDVEVGGFVPFGDTTPPPAMIKPLLDGQVPWIVKVAEKLPRLRILKTEVQPRSGGVYILSMWVENAGGLPFPTAMGQKNQHVGPGVVTLDAVGLTFLSGRARTAVNAVDAGRNVKIQWMVQAPEGTAINAAVQSANAWGDTATIRLVPAQGGVR